MPLRRHWRSKAATINDIARLSGVSKKTVSRIINNSPLVRKDTRDKVEALMREVGYTPDPLARGLAFRRSFLIGMVYDNPTAQYIVDMQYGALDALRGSSFELVVHRVTAAAPATSRACGASCSSRSCTGDSGAACLGRPGAGGHA